MTIGKFLILLWVIIWVLPIPVTELSAEELILSMATGFQGVNEVGQHSKLQEKYELAPSQVQRLQDFLNDGRIKAEYDRVYRAERQRRVEYDGASRAAYRHLDKIVQKEIGQILTEEQISAIRKNYLRRRFPQSRLVFQQPVLLQLEFSSSEISHIFTVLGPLIAELTKNEKATIESAIRQIADGFTKEQHLRLEKLLGTMLVTEKSVPSVDSVTQLEVGTKARPFYQVVQSLVCQLPGDLSISDEQRVKLTRICNRELGRRARAPGTLNDSGIRDELATVLSHSQRVAVIQVVHQRLLIRDLSWVCENEVIEYLGLEESEITKVKAQVDSWKTKISEQQVSSDQQIFEEGVERLPDAKRADFLSLFSEVWE